MIIPINIIFLIALYLNATNTRAFRLVCKKFSRVPLNRFRLCVEGKLPPGEYYYVTYIGHNPATDLKNCIIRKLWLFYGDNLLSPTTKVLNLVVDSIFWKKHDYPKKSEYKICTNSKFCRSIIRNDCVIGEFYGVFNKKKNLTLYNTIYNTDAPVMSYDDFKKVKIHHRDAFFGSNIKKLSISLCYISTLNRFTSLTYLELKSVSVGDTFEFPPNLKTLKLVCCSSLLKLLYLPKKLEKLKIKTEIATVLGALEIPESLRWFKLVVPTSLNHLIPIIPLERNIRFIVKLL